MLAIEKPKQPKDYQICLVGWIQPEDERNEIYRRYMELRNLYRECKGVIYEESVVN